MGTRGDESDRKNSRRSSSDNGVRSAIVFTHVKQAAHIHDCNGKEKENATCVLIAATDASSATATVTSAAAAAALVVVHTIIIRLQIVNGSVCQQKHSSLIHIALVDFDDEIGEQNHFCCDRRIAAVAAVVVRFQHFHDLHIPCQPEVVITLLHDGRSQGRCCVHFVPSKILGVCDVCLCCCFKVCFVQLTQL